MKDYRNFILINTNNFIATATYANCSSDVVYKKYKKEHPVRITSNLDALKILNKHLAQILQWKENEQALSIYYILIPPKLCKIIKDKLYRQWINESASKIKEEELTQWKIFDLLYKSVFADVVFKPNNIYNSKDVNKVYRHIVFTKKVIDKMYDYLNKLEENLKVKSIDSLLK